MKQILNNKIINIPNTPLFDNVFLFEYLNTDFLSNQNIEIFFIQKELKKVENKKLLAEIGDRYAMYSNVYSEKNELEIFTNLFNYAINNNKKIHIVGITLDEEVKILEDYYTKLGFLREDINCFKVDFSIPLVTVGVNIENLIWRGSDYKKQKENIYFLPPIREAGQTKAMFKGINRGVIANINIKDINLDKVEFLKNCILEEHILSITLAKVLCHNLIGLGFDGEKKDIFINY